MNVLFDTNVLLDVLLDREPFAQAAARLVGRVERKELAGLIGATTLTTLHDLVTKVAGRDKAMEAVRKVLGIFQVAAVDRVVLELATTTTFSDFEDAVLHEAGRLAGADVIVTRNPSDFSSGSLLIHTPDDLEAMLTAGSD